MTMMKLKAKQGKLWQIAGLILVLIAVLLTVYNLLDEYRANLSVEKTQSQMVFEKPLTSDDVGEMVIPDYILNPDMPMPTEEIDGYRYIGKLDIPSLEMSLPIISEWSYKALKVAPCCYNGSIYKDNMVIAAHNYSRHFGNIKSLAEGSDITFTDIDGNVFEYSVSETEVIKPTAIDKMVFGDWDLTLFTCTVGGQARVAVRCVREN